MAGLTCQKFDLSRYKELYFHHKDWKKPGWISHRRYIPNPIPFKGPGVVVNVCVNSGIPPGEFDITRYEKLYLKKVAEEKSKIKLFKTKGKFWQKVDKSPLFSKNRKKLTKGINLSASNAMEKSKRDEKKKRVTAGNKPVNTQVPNTEKAREARRRASAYVRNKSK